MRLFHVTADPVDAGAAPLSAIVIAKDEDEAVLLLRKDFNFAHHQLPPREMRACDAGHEAVRRTLGDAAQREKGVYRVLPATP